MLFMNKKIFILLFIIMFSFLTFADVETLRPNSDYSVVLTPVNCVNNYECVDEASANDDTDYLHTTAVQVYQYDLFDLPDYSGGAFDTINSVKIYYRVRCENAGGSVCKFKSRIEVDGTTYDGTEKLSTGTNYVTYSETYTTNPDTSSAWTISEVNDLKAGVGLNGFLNSDGNRARATQVYVEVDFTEAQQPNITFVSPLNF